MLLVHAAVMAQGLAITAYGGATIQDKMYGYYGDIIVKGGGHFGGVLSYRRSSQIAVELTYQNQPTTFQINDYYGGPLNSYSGDYAGSVSYIMFGVSHSPDFNAKIAPFGGFMLGTAIFTPKDTFSDEWRFAVGGKLGATIHANDKIGIVIQTQLMIPVQGAGLGVGCGTYGCGGGASASSTATQLGFTGGIEYRLSN